MIFNILRNRVIVITVIIITEIPGFKIEVQH